MRAIHRYGYNQPPTIIREPPSRTIPIPIHPDDADLPVSAVQLKLPGGAIATLVLPIQGEKTLDATIKILELWKPSIVKQGDLDYQI